MTTTRYVADHLITMDGAGSVHSPGVVDVVDGAVAWSGPAADAPVATGDEVRVPGLLMPGFVNAHAHTPMVLLRGTGEGLPTDRWLTDVMWPREQRLTADDVACAMRVGAAEMLLNGITTTSEMYFFAGAIADAATEAGLRSIVAAPLIEGAGFGHFGTIDEQLSAIRDLRARWAGDRLVEIAVGPHSAYALSREALVKVADLVAGDPMLVHIHIAEQPNEGDGVRAATGLGVPAYLDSLGLLTERTIGAHCVWIDDAEIELFATRGTSVAHCPASNGRHASGIAAISAMRAAGITVGLGTDGPASHDRLDPFEEMRTAVRLARIGQRDASGFDAALALRLATSEAADALGRPDLGRLVAGSRADMIAIDVEVPGFAPLLDPGELPGRVVWSATPAAVRSVWVDGVAVVDDGRCLTVDRTEATAEMTARARHLISP